MTGVVGAVGICYADDEFREAVVGVAGPLNEGFAEEQGEVRVTIIRQASLQTSLLIRVRTRVPDEVDSSSNCAFRFSNECPQHGEVIAVVVIGSTTPHFGMD